MGNPLSLRCFFSCSQQQNSYNVQAIVLYIHYCLVLFAQVYAWQRNSCSFYDYTTHQMDLIQSELLQFMKCCLEHLSIYCGVVLNIAYNQRRSREVNMHDKIKCGTSCQGKIFLLGTLQQQPSSLMQSTIRFKTRPLQRLHDVSQYQLVGLLYN